MQEHLYFIVSLVFLEFCQTLSASNLLENSSAYAREFTTYDTYKLQIYAPRWHVNTHKKNCSLGGSSENICILQTLTSRKAD